MNLWRLLNARIRAGRGRVLILMCGVALAMGAVIIGLAGRLGAGTIWDMPGGLAGALIAITAAGFVQIRAETRIGQWMSGLSRQVRRAILTYYAALEPRARAGIDGAAVRDALLDVPRGLVRPGGEMAVAVQSFLTTLACVIGTLVINPIAGAALLLALKLGAITTTALTFRARNATLAAQADDSAVVRGMEETFRAIGPSLLATPAQAPLKPAPLETAITARRVRRVRRLGWFAAQGAAGAIGRPLLAILVAGAVRLSGQPADQAIAMLLIAFLVPFDWIEAIPRLTSLSAAADRLAGTDAEMGQAAERWPVPGEPDHAAFASLELRAAVFRYPAHPGAPGAVVGPVSCAIRPGRVLFVTGGIRSGKTSVLAMLAGLAAPEAGEVLRDGTVGDGRRSRGLVAYAASGATVFTGAAIPNFDRPDVQRLISDLDLGGLPAVLAGRVPDAATLQYSVQARVALLIAVAGDRPVLLLDEWDARQSPAMRTWFYTVLLPRLRSAGRAVVVATTDERHNAAADEILRLEDGGQV